MTQGSIYRRMVTRDLILTQDLEYIIADDILSRLNTWSIVPSNPNDNPEASPNLHVNLHPNLLGKPLISTVTSVLSRLGSR